MGLQFLRVAYVEFGPAGGTGKAFRDLRVSFSVKKGRHRGTTPNHSTVTIFNLTKDSVSILNEPSAVIRLFAGYNGVPVLIFEGNPIPNGVRVDKQGADRVTKVEAMDGWYQTQTTRIRIDNAGNMSLKDVLDEVAAQLGLPRGAIDLPQDQNVLGNPLGFSANSLAGPLLTQVCNSLDCDWWIDSGRLYVARRGRPVDGDAVFVSGTTGGLVGSPSPRTLIGSASKSNDGTEITMLLTPEMAPGKLVSVQSDQVNGAFIAQQVEHVGDSHQGSWYTKVLGIPYRSGSNG